MYRVLKSLVPLVLAVLPLAATARAEEPCLYAAYEPVNLKTLLDDGFDRQGLFYLPDGFAGVSTVDGTMLAARSGSLFRGGAIVAQVNLLNDPVRDSQDLAVLDARGQWLLTARLRVHQCGDALCKDIEITPRRDGGTVAGTIGAPGQGGQPDGDAAPQDRAPFFMRWSFPSGYPLETFVYGERVEPRVFQAAVGDSLQWLERAVAGTNVTTSVILSDSVSRMRFEVIKDALLRPYYSLLNYEITGGKYVVIKGRVPSDEHYGRAIDLAREEELIVTDIQVIIDTRLRQVHEFPPPLMCQNNL